MWFIIKFITDIQIHTLLLYRFALQLQFLCL